VKTESLIIGIKRPNANDSVFTIFIENKFMFFFALHFFSHFCILFDPVLLHFILFFDAFFFLQKKKHQKKMHQKTQTKKP
jgi:hypothetical protein